MRNRNELFDAYFQILRIRMFEEKILDLFSKKLLSGTTHTYIGQEATAVALMLNLTEEDFIFSNHRCHGHYLAYGGQMDQLMAEIMSKSNGVCKGLGGSQHIHYKNLFSNGIQGGIVPNAAGIALAQKINGKDGIAVVFIGDGTLGQGVVYETFNIASLYDIPVLFVIEDNGYAMSTKNTDGVAGDISMRPKAFGIETAEITSNDVRELDEQFNKAVSYVRTKKKPFCQIVHTYRLAAHSKGDDFRDRSEIEKWKKKDPLSYLAPLIPEGVKREYVDVINAQLEKAISFGINGEYCNISEIGSDKMISGLLKGSMLNQNEETYGKQLNNALSDIMQRNSNVIVMGEDICDPYGGAFKITKGLSSNFPDRVMNMPISEAGYIGLGVGLALGGKIAIAEVMFGDFLSLGFDQIINHATKYGAIYGDEIDVPLIIRAPMGAGRGYGATHSQSLEKYFLGIPNLQTIALSPLHDIGKLMDVVAENIRSPLLIIESKTCYPKNQFSFNNGKTDVFWAKETDSIFPIIKLSLDPESLPDAVIVTYGGMTEIAMSVSKTLMLERELQIDILVCTQISPMPPIDEWKQVLAEGVPVFALEEGTAAFGWGAEICTVLSSLPIKRAERIASKNMAIPCGVVLEKNVIPDEEMVKSFIKKEIV